MGIFTGEDHSTRAVPREDRFSPSSHPTCRSGCHTVTHKCGHCSMDPKRQRFLRDDVSPEGGAWPTDGVHNAEGGGMHGDIEADEQIHGRAISTLQEPAGRLTSSQSHVGCPNHPIFLFALLRTLLPSTKKLPARGTQEQNHPYTREQHADGEAKATRAMTFRTLTALCFRLSAFPGRAMRDPAFRRQRQPLGGPNLLPRCINHSNSGAWSLYDPTAG
jgi:hypothetical protein